MRSSRFHPGRLLIMVLAGAVLCLLTHRFSYLITLASAYERAAAQSVASGPREFRVVQDGGFFFFEDPVPLQTAHADVESQDSLPPI